ncbi:MAG: hypothetical protein RSE32_08150 [Comamonas sp.]|uniref:phage head spike fiber domain-containing protein n=1 Tax=Comamonas sp. TaxID=34028 RepID=UPI002FC957D6
MTTIPNLPAARPARQFDFAGSGRIHPLMQFSRASVGTCFGPDGLLRRVGSNVPRIDYDPETGECLGLLFEESETNLALQSEDFANAAWVKQRATIAAKVMLSPDGTAMADALVSDNQAAAEHGVSQLNMAATFAQGDRFFFSVFVKPGQKSKVALRLRRSLSSGFVTGYFDLVTGETNVTGASQGATLSLQRKKLPNGWTWCCIEYFAGSTDGADPLVAYVYPADLMTSTLYDGTGAQDLYLFGAQCTKRNWSSSYIATTTAQVTRAADVASMAARDLGWVGQRGTMVAEARMNLRFRACMPFFLGPSVTFQNANCVSAWLSQSNNTELSSAAVYIKKADVIYLGTSFGSAPRAVWNKIGVAVDAGNFTSAFNGVLVNATGELPAINFISFGYQFTGHIRKIAFFAAAVTGPELGRLTA